MADLDIKEESSEFVAELYSDCKEQMESDEMDFEDHGVGYEKGEHLDHRKPSMIIPDVLDSQASSPGYGRRRSGKLDRSRSPIKSELQTDTRRRVTYNQLESLWKFLNENRELATGFNKTIHAREFSKRMWKSVAQILNSKGEGAVKDWKNWSKYWNDFKSKLKKKVSSTRTLQQRTGAPSTEAQLSELEMKFIQMLGEDFGAGHPGARTDPLNEPIAVLLDEPKDELSEVDSESLLAHNTVPPNQELVVTASQPPPPAVPCSPPPPVTPPAAGSAPHRPRRRRHKLPITMDTARRYLIEISERRAVEDRRRNDLLEALVQEIREIKGILSTRLPSSSGISTPFKTEDETNVMSTPDAYGQVISEQVENDDDEWDSDETVREYSRRGRGRLSRGRGAGRPGGGKRFHWEVGQPLHEIWPTDDDIPKEWNDMEKTKQSDRKLRNNKGNVFQDTGRGVENEDLLEWFPMKTFQGKEEIFKPTLIGATKAYETAYDAFRSYWNDDLLQYVVDETNRYASTILSTVFRSEWYDTNTHEILCLFSFWVMLGIIRMPTITTCFSMNPLLRTEIFRSIFTGRRYNNLVRALDFDDTESTKNGRDENTDRLHRLRPIITHLNAEFKNNYVPSKDISIDESVMSWRGKLNIKQYSRTQPTNFYGIKTYELSESSTGYLWSFIVYSGKNNTLDTAENPMEFNSTAVVKALINPLLNKGYRLFMDDWYNSPHLALFLKTNGMDCVGPLPESCPNIPWFIQNAPLKRGQILARHSGDVCVLSWEDVERVHMITTCHGTALGMQTVSSRARPARTIPFKPQAVLDYDKFTGGVNLKDEMLEPYLLERARSTKWHMKLFKRLVNCSILNARLLLESSNKSQDHLTLCLDLVNSIVTKHLSHCPIGRRLLMNRQMPNPARIVHHTHWPVRVQQSPKDLERKRQARHSCSVCVREGRKHQKTPYKCETCNVPLCVVECFKIYHTT